MITIHLTGLVFSLGVMLYADKQVVSWLRGKPELLDAKKLERTHILMWVGLGAMVASGIYMLIPQWSYLSAEPLFMIKMFFVGILITNGVLIGRLAPIATLHSFRSLTLKEKLPLFASGAISLTAWVGAFAMAKILF